MSNYVFTGKLIPDLGDVSFHTPTPMTMHSVDAGLQFDIIISICNSQISATVKALNESSDLQLLRNYVRDTIRIL